MSIVKVRCIKRTSTTTKNKLYLAEPSKRSVGYWKPIYELTYRITNDNGNIIHVFRNKFVKV